MGKISTTITLNDEVSRKLDTMISSLEKFTKSFESIEKSFSTFAQNSMMIQKNINLSNNALGDMVGNSKGVTQSINNTSQSAKKLADNLLDAKRNANSIKLPSKLPTNKISITPQINSDTLKKIQLGNRFKNPSIKTDTPKYSGKLKMPSLAKNQKIKIIADDKAYKRSLKDVQEMLKNINKIADSMLDGSVRSSGEILANFIKTKAVAREIEKNSGKGKKGKNGKNGEKGKKKKNNYLDNFVANFAGNLLANTFQNALSGLKEVALTAVDTASSIIEVANVTETVFGEELSRGTLDKWAKSTIDNFGITELQAKKWAGVMGSIMSDAIDDKGVLMKMSMDIAQLAGDLASFDNLDPEDAFFKLRSAMVGETEPIKSLGINMSIASLEAFALEKGIKKTTRQMNNAEMTLLRYNYLIEKTAFKQGDYSKTSQEFANRVRTMQGRFQSLTGELARGFLPILSTIAQALIDVMKAIEPVISAIADWIIAVFEAAQENEGLRISLTILGTLLAGFMVLSLGMFIAKIFSAIKTSQLFNLNIFKTSKVVQNLAFQMFFIVGIFAAVGFATMKLHWAFKLFILAIGIGILVWSIFNKTMAVNPFVVLIGLIVMVAIWLIHLWNTNEAFRVWLITAWANIVASIQSFVAKLVFAIQYYVILICYYWENMILEISLGWEWCGIALHNIWNGIQAGAYDMCANILQSVEDMVNGTIDLINMFINVVSKIPGINIDTIDHVSFSAIDKLKQKANDRRQEIEDRNNAFNSKAEGKRNELNSKYSDKLTGKFGELNETLNKIEQDRQNMISNAGNSKPIFENLFGGGKGGGGKNGKDGDGNEGDNNYGLQGYNPNFSGGGLGGGKGAGGKGSGGKGKGGKGGKLDRVDTIGKIEDEIEIDDIEILLELSRDRYQKDYSVTNDFSIVVNQQGDGKVDPNDLANEILDKVGDKMVDAINRSMV